MQACLILQNLLAHLPQVRICTLLVWFLQLRITFLHCAQGSKFISPPPPSAYTTRIVTFEINSSVRRSTIPFRYATERWYQILFFTLCCRHCSNQSEERASGRWNNMFCLIVYYIDMHKNVQSIQVCATFIDNEVAIEFSHVKIFLYLNIFKIIFKYRQFK